MKLRPPRPKRYAFRVSERRKSILRCRAIWRRGARGAWSSTVDEELVDEGAAPRPMSFELAGPRDRIYFDPSKTKCAIVTCGGLCPGINDVIRAIVMTAYNAYRVPSVLGIRYGLQGFIPSYRYDVRELAPRDVEGSTSSGGRSSGRPEGRSLHPKSPPPLSA